MFKAVSRICDFSGRDIMTAVGGCKGLVTLKQVCFCANIPRLLESGKRNIVAFKAEVAELVDALDLGSSVL